MQLHKRFLLALPLVTLIFADAATYAAAPPTDEEKWAYQAANIAFKRVAMHGAIDGIPFQPINGEIWCHYSKDNPNMNASHAEGGADIKLKDGGGRLIEIQVYNREKFRNVVLKQGAYVPANGAEGVDVAIDHRSMFKGQFGIHLSLGEVSADDTQPIFIVLRQNKDNWLEGYIYCKAYSK